MKFLLNCLFAGVLGMICGCSTLPPPEISPKDLACIVKIEKFTDPEPGCYILSMKMISENGNAPLQLPRLIVKSGKVGGVELQSQPVTPDFMLNTDSFGPLLCQSCNGGRYVVKVEETPDPNLVKADLFVLSVQDRENGLVTVQHLDVPSTPLPLNKEVLLFNQNGKVTHCTVDGPDGEKIKFEFINE